MVPDEGQSLVFIDGALTITREGPIVTIRLTNPDQRNAQIPQLWRELAAFGEQLPADVRAVVLRADGQSFSAGLDRRMFAEGVPGEKPLAEMANMSDDEFDQLIAEFQRGFTWWRESPAVTIALVQGHAVGAGFQLALAADLLIVAPDVQFAMKETSLGLVPDLAGTQPLVEAVGYARAMEICTSGRWVDADEAVRIGLALRSVPVDQFDATVTEILTPILNALPSAVAETKFLLRDAVTRTRDEQCAAERQAQRRRINELADLMGIRGS